MADLTRRMDWSTTPLGPIDKWPQSLRTSVDIMLSSRYAMFVWWGHELTNLYNDAYRPFLGKKHPQALGRSAREVWAEIWDLIGPRTEAVLERGEATFDQALLLIMERFGYPEETYFTFSYSPIRNDRREISGLFCAVTDETSRVIGERRLRLLREVAAASARTHTPEQVCAATAGCVSRNARDLPFALIYLTERNGKSVRLVAQAGIAPGSPGAEPFVELESDASVWPIAEAALGKDLVVVERLASRIENPPTGAWDRPPDGAVVVPLQEHGGEGFAGFLIAGLNPYLVFDEEYRGFIQLLAGQITAGIASARAYQEERKRAEALAEIDRAKTAFFSNVSHEFRTPLTLMMAPLEEALADSATLSAVERSRLELAHRNALRLLKLVNTLLDFSRIEAGRIEASYAPVDLAALTAELSSVFRSAIERAGMKLVIDCPPLSEPVYVDRDMWEKVVLNLLSNAFKFTFDGQIEVSLRQAASSAQLTIRDTGTGIPADEIPRLFERFHRVKGARGRSYEGSGIGLALVQELVRLHGGSVHVESELGKGSRFIASVPFGKSHLPAGCIAAEEKPVSLGIQRQAYLDEAERWLPGAPDVVPAAMLPDPTLAESQTHSPKPPKKHAPAQRVLLADDNTDMRDYVRRLLAQRGYDVEAVADGEAAFRAALRHKPDLILTDIMMPGLDGFELLREIRGDSQLGEIPVILLSARAGEEARIEGMHAGADDYLIKPFSARELLARVESHLKMAQLRHESMKALRYRTAQFETLLSQVPVGVYLVDSGFRIREINPVALPVFGNIPGGVMDRDFDEIIHILWQKEYADELVRMFRHTLETGEPYIAPERGEFRADRGVTEYYEWRIDRILLPDGRFGVVCCFRDISQRVQADNTRQLLLGELNHRVKNTLASVQAIAQQTLRSTKEPADFAARFSGRIQSLARVHSLLTDATWQGTGLRELIRDQLLQGSVDESRLTAWGPAVQLQPEFAVHLALMLHELGTNSVKHGGLSVPSGTVSINWLVKDNTLTLNWIERGGPVVRTPIARGFGTTLIERSAKGEGGSAEMLCEAAGVTWRITLPLPDVAKPGPLTKEPKETDAGPQSDRKADERSAMLAGMRLLVIEDEPLIALDLVDRLTKAGAEVAEPVGTENEALQTIADGDFDMAVLDANLHGRPVGDIAAALTRHEIPFVFVTGYGDANLPSSFQHAPVVAKPFSDAQLLEAIMKLAPTPATVTRLSR
jgi:PAS domain S-box-containing protein